MPQPNGANYFVAADAIPGFTNILQITNEAWRQSSKHLLAKVKGLREFTHKVVPFQWSDSQDKAFVESKMLNAQDPVLCHLNPQLPITQQVDVSN